MSWFEIASGGLDVEVPGNSVLPKPELETQLYF